MRVVTWNARHGGGSRASAFAERLNALEPDVAVITEFRNGSTGNKIKKTLLAGGYTYFSTVDSPPKLNSVLLCSRMDFIERRLDSLGDDSHRCAWAQIGDVNVLGFYFPQNQAKAKIFDSILGLDGNMLSQKSLLVGDFNTGRHFVDESGKTFHCADQFDRLQELGWVDAWRSRNPVKKEYSWYSNSGNGFRIDHALVSPKLDREIRNVYYDHDVRESALSDHSAMIVDFDCADA